MFDKPEQHQSFGMLGFDHTQSNGTVLVGSEFVHQHCVQFTIRRAEKRRDLSREQWFGKNELVRAYLSEAQFVELISRPNMGDGVPCTLVHVMGERMPNPPEPVSMKEKFRADLDQDTSKCVRDLREATEELNRAIDEGRIGKTVLREIAKKLEFAARAVDSGIPFVERQFEEAMEATVRHAAAEIEATVVQTAVRLGLEQMRDLSTGAPKLIEAVQPESSPSDGTS